MQTIGPRTLLHNTIPVLALAALLGARTIMLTDEALARHGAAPYAAMAAAIGTAATISLLIVVIVLLTYRRRGLQAEGVRRAAIASGVSKHMIGKEAMVENGLPLLPHTIRLKLDWSRYPSILPPYLALAVLSACASFMFLDTPVAPPEVLLPRIAAAILLVGTLYSTWALLVFASDARQRIIIFDNRLALDTSRYSLRRYVFWNDARLFAISPGQPRDRPPVWYELVGPHTTLHFVRLRRDMPYQPFELATATTPTIPFEEYDEQMEALIRFIEAKTGLSLTDVR